jgi:hypothetical protein
MITAIPAKPASPDAARPSETGFRKLSPEKPVNNAGPVTFSAGIADMIIYVFNFLYTLDANINNLISSPCNKKKNPIVMLACLINWSIIYPL